MGTLILDYDSTLVPCESLEVILARNPSVDADAMAQIDAITRDGMDGRIPFRESLERRFALAEPTRSATFEIGRELATATTAGARELVAAVRGRGHRVVIVSGALREVIFPLAEFLGIDVADVHAVQARWTTGGAFSGLDDDDPFSTSKVAGAAAVGDAWPAPRVGVGDGATDRALLTAGVVDHFVAYIEHVRREAVLAHGDPTARNMEELRSILASLLP